MVLYQYYSRKEVTETETEFFDTSMAEAPHKELDTNLLKDRQLINDFAVDRIIVYLPFSEISNEVFHTDLQLEDQKILVDDGVIVIKIGAEAERYYRLAECLDNIAVSGEVSLLPRGDAKDRYQLGSVFPANGEKGREVDFTIPADTNVIVTLKTLQKMKGTEVVIIFSGTE